MWETTQTKTSKGIETQNMYKDTRSGQDKESRERTVRTDANPEAANAPAIDCCGARSIDERQTPNDQGERWRTNDSQMQPTCDPAVRSTVLLGGNSWIFKHISLWSKDSDRQEVVRQAQGLYLRSSPSKLEGDTCNATQ